jgi:2-hydroxy-3-oxopropionate reductase
MLKDLSFVRDSAGIAGTAAPMAAAGVALYAELVAQGLGDQDLAVVRQAIANLATPGGDGDR